MVGVYLFFKAAGFVLGCLLRLAWAHPQVTFLIIATWVIASSL